MVSLKGRVIRGCGDFGKRMTKFPELFERATGETLFPGTINVKVGGRIKIKEQFRIVGKDIDEPEQDLLFEKCLINNQFSAYRIRPYHLKTGTGGWGDDVLEIACSKEIMNVNHGAEIEITMFRNKVRFWYEYYTCVLSRFVNGKGKKKWG